MSGRKRRKRHTSVKKAPNQREHKTRDAQTVYYWKDNEDGTKEEFYINCPADLRTSRVVVTTPDGWKCRVGPPIDIHTSF